MRPGLPGSIALVSKIRFRKRLGSAFQFGCEPNHPTRVIFDGNVQIAIRWGSRRGIWICLERQRGFGCLLHLPFAGKLAK